MTVVTRRDAAMDASVLENYLCNLVNLFFKILPIRENGEQTLGIYMESLQAELLGCAGLVISLQGDPLFVTLVSILQYLIDHPESSPSVFKREVFKAISVCKKLNKRYAAAPKEEGCG